MNIRLATMEDDVKIKELMNSAMYDKEKDQSNTGFFYVKYTLERVQQALREEIFYVAVENDEIIGYVWPQSKKQFAIESEGLFEISPDDESNWYFVRQLISKPKTGKFVGKALYDYIKEEFKSNIWAGVFVNPLNQRSIDFHINQGFKEKFEIEQTSGNIIGVYVYEYNE